MYQNYFGMIEAPFSIAPDPRYLYMSQRHQEALATLLYGVSSDGGFVLLTGDVGAGKTTICRSLLDQVPENSDVAYIFNPKLTVVELLSTVCDEFGISYPQGTTSIKQFVDAINEYLLDSHAKGRRAVLIIDEAQNLSADVLEQMRLLTNLETNQRKLLQILLIGQPELVEILARQELRQLAQRIIARYHLKPLNKNEVKAYVKYRLEVSGVQRQLFPNAVLNKLYRLSGGVPRLINLLCDRALLGAFVQSKDRVDGSTLAQAAREVFNAHPKPRLLASQLLAAGLVLLLGSALAVNLYWHDPLGNTLPKTQKINFQAASKTVPTEAPVLPAVIMPPPVTATPELIKAVATLPTVLELPTEEAYSHSKEIAYAALFQAWGAPYSESGQACTQAKTQGLHCWAMRGGLEELRQLNMPAVLEMLDGHDRKYYVTLIKLEAESATFDLGTKVYDVSLGALALQWTGNYTLLTRLPENVKEKIETGERGATVEWMSKQLAITQGREVESKLAVFDDRLKRQIKQFQLSQGLVPDGAAGPRTMLRLSAVTNQSAPRLSTQKQGKE